MELTKVCVLITCPGKRFVAGEIGTVLKNDFDKYDYKVDLGPSNGLFEGRRIYYFYKHEVKICS